MAANRAGLTQALAPMVVAIDNREYASDATLLILGDALDPALVSRCLRLRPSQSWKRGEQKRSMGIAFDSVHAWGGWKKCLPPAQEQKDLTSQLRYWVRALRGRAPAFAQLTKSGHHCSLDCFVSTDATASIVFPPDLQVSMAALGLELRISLFSRGG